VTLDFALKVFWVLAALLAIQSLAALRDGFRFLDFVRRRRATPPSDIQPRVTVIIPCKGLDSGFEKNLEGLLTQNYSHYQLIFVVARQDDPAYAALDQILLGRPQATLLVAGEAEGRGEKVNNLLKALASVDPAVEVLVFADIDARPAPDWLRSLVSPLDNSSVTVSTGFRWYLPGRGFASRLRAAWDTSIAMMLGENRANFAWGGSMAIRAEDFRRLQIAERYWQGTVSDDYALARAVRDAGGRIAFEPRCLVASREESSFGELLNWTNRQIIITRVYASHLWGLGLAAYTLYALTMLAGAVLIFTPGIAMHARIAIVALLGVIQLLGIAKGWIRAVVAREIFREPGTSCYWTLAPLVPWVMLYNFIVAAFVRRIEWRGTEYELVSSHEVRILRRNKA